MADPFADALDELRRRYDWITAAAFTDLDGEDIARSPRDARESLRLCAAYGGIALRRLSTAETGDFGRQADQLFVSGTRGSMAAVRVGGEYQLVVTISGPVSAGQVMHAVRPTVDKLLAQV